MADSTITSYPSLTTSWVPDSSCVASTGFWYVVYATDVVFSDMFGMPSVTNVGQGSTPTGGCVPPSYTLSVPYLTDGGCPANYTPACSSITSYSSQSADYVMCCPSVSGWNFNCAAATAPAPLPYGCQAGFTDGAIITGSRTDLVAKTGQAETHTVGGDNGVNAWGIALLSTVSSSTIGTTSSPKPTSNSNPSAASVSGSTTSNSASSAHGLSTGASAGIGVGVGVVALAIIGLLAFWLLRRKRKAKQEKPPPIPWSYYQDGAAQKQNHVSELQSPDPPSQGRIAATQATSYHEMPS